MSALGCRHENKETTMKYFVLLAMSGGPEEWANMTPERQEAEMGKHIAFSQAIAARDDVTEISTEALAPASMATTLRIRGGEMAITDGPFAEAAEQIGGYYVLDAPDLDTVIELCRILPDYDIEIRPILELG